VTVTEPQHPWFDLDEMMTPSPTQEDKDRLTARLERVRGGLGKSAAQVTEQFAQLAEQHGGLGEHFVIRRTFMHQKQPAAIDPRWSDRKLPPRDARPSATRIMTSRGCALRFYLTALAEAQFRLDPGTTADNLYPVRSDELSWTDFLASASYDSSKRLDIKIRDKKQRSIQTALRTLEKAELVELPPPVRGRRSYDGFTLMNEQGARRTTDPRPYTVPSDIGHAKLPAGFITRGWIHFLEDSEIVVLLMIACGIGNVSGKADWVAIGGAERVAHYGLGRDAYEAHFMLKRLGLIERESLGRSFDHKFVENFGQDDVEAYVHRMRLRPEGFEQDPQTVLEPVIEKQLARPVRS
jgi:hypothetical protein